MCDDMPDFEDFDDEADDDDDDFPDFDDDWDRDSSGPTEEAWKTTKPQKSMTLPRVHSPT